MSNSKIIPRTPEEKVSRRCPTPTRICWNSGPVTKIKMKHYIHSLQCYSPHLRFNLLQSHLNWNQISWMTCYRVKRWRHRNLLFLCLHRKSYKHCSISKWKKVVKKKVQPLLNQRVYVSNIICYQKWRKYNLRWTTTWHTVSHLFISASEMLRQSVKMANDHYGQNFPLWSHLSTL